MKELYKRVGVLAGFLTLVSILIGGLLGINLHAEKIVKKEIKPVEKRLSLVEEDTEKNKKDFKKLVVALMEKQDLTIDILYKMDEKAFLKAKKERETKYGKQ